MERVSSCVFHEHKANSRRTSARLSRTAPTEFICFLTFPPPRAPPTGCQVVDHNQSSVSTDIIDHHVFRTSYPVMILLSLRMNFRAEIARFTRAIIPLSYLLSSCCLCDDEIRCTLAEYSQKTRINLSYASCTALRGCRFDFTRL